MAELDVEERESIKARVAVAAEQVSASMGTEIVLVEVKFGAGRSVVRAYIDKPGGISLDDCERFSKRLSVVLDVEDSIPFSYVLEVSSPGLDRPLVKEAHFLQFVGRKAKVRTKVPVNGQKNFTGTILGVADGRLMLERVPGEQVDIALADVEKANLVTEI
jgi:ribosome maturation factor RimP